MNATDQSKIDSYPMSKFWRRYYEEISRAARFLTILAETKSRLDKICDLIAKCRNADEQKDTLRAIDRIARSSHHEFVTAAISKPNKDDPKYVILIKDTVNGAVSLADTERQYNAYEASVFCRNSSTVYLQYFSVYETEVASYLTERKN